VVVRSSSLEGLDVNRAPTAALAGRRVLVTGHTGFKGSWLTLWLHRLGAVVSGLALPPPTEPSNFVASGVASVLERHILADIRDRARVVDTVSELGPEIIFHLAAQSLVRVGYAEPADTFATNVIGTVNLLEAVRLRARPCVVVVVTSDKCYENREQALGCREGDPLGGDDPYAASKGAAELATAAYRSAFFHPSRLAEHGVRITSVRAGNAIGGGDWSPDRIVVDAIAALQADRPIPVRNPDSTRPWQHVLEPLAGYLVLAARLLENPSPELCSAFNFGPRSGDQSSVAVLVGAIIRAWGSGEWADHHDPNQPHETRTLHLAIDKAVTLLPWRPRWTVREAVDRTVAWYRQYGRDAGGSMRAACAADIAAYERAAGWE
jgi:CDP-glucose 4,6-dehydratase